MAGNVKIGALGFSIIGDDTPLRKVIKQWEEQKHTIRVGVDGAEDVARVTALLKEQATAIRESATAGREAAQVQRLTTENMLKQLKAFADAANVLSDAEVANARLAAHERAQAAKAAMDAEKLRHTQAMNQLAEEKRMNDEVTASKKRAAQEAAAAAQQAKSEAAAAAAKSREEAAGLGLDAARSRAAAAEHREQAAAAAAAGAQMRTDMTAQKKAALENAGAMKADSDAVDEVEVSNRQAATAISNLTLQLNRGAVGMDEYRKKTEPFADQLLAVSAAEGELSTKTLAAERALSKLNTVSLSELRRNAKSELDAVKQAVREASIVGLDSKTGVTTKEQGLARAAAMRQEYDQIRQGILGQIEALRAKGQLDADQTKRVQILTAAYKDYSSAIASLDGVTKQLNGTQKQQKENTVRALSDTDLLVMKSKEHTSTVSRLIAEEKAGIISRRQLIASLREEMAAVQTSQAVAQGKIAALQKLDALNDAQIKDLNRLVEAENRYAKAVATSTAALRNVPHEQEKRVLSPVGGFVKASGGKARPGMDDVAMGAGFINADLGMMAMAASAGPWVAGAAAVGIFAKSLVDATVKAGDFDAAMNRVQALVHLSAEGTKELGDFILDLSTKLPITAVQLGEIARQGVMVGMKSTEDLKMYTQNMASMSVILAKVGHSQAEVELTGQELVKILRSIGMEGPELNAMFGQMVNGMVKLKTESGLLIPEVTQLMKFWTSQGAHVGLTVAQMTALSAALVQTGARAQGAGGALSIFFDKAAMAAAKGGEAMSGWAKTMNLSNEEAAKLLKMDPMQFLARFIEGAKDAEHEGTAFSISLREAGLNSQQVRRTMAELSLAMELVAKNTDLMETGMRENNLSMDIAQATTKNYKDQVQLLHNAWDKILINLGGPLAEMFTGWLEKITPVVKELGTLVDHLNKVKSPGEIQATLKVDWSKDSATLIAVKILAGAGVALGEFQNYSAEQDRKVVRGVIDTLSASDLQGKLQAAKILPVPGGPGDSLRQLNEIKANLEKYRQALADWSAANKAAGEKMLASIKPTQQAAEAMTALSGLSAMSLLGNLRPGGTRYGNQYDPDRNGKSERHNGEDLFAPVGTAVKASFSGLLETRWSETTGRILTLIDAQGKRLLLGHMVGVKDSLKGLPPEIQAAFAASGGRAIQVNKGDVIGYVGQTGSKSNKQLGPGNAHVHVMAFDENGNEIDPKGASFTPNPGAGVRRGAGSNSYTPVDGRGDPDASLKAGLKAAESLIKQLGLAIKSGDGVWEAKATANLKAFRTNNPSYWNSQLEDMLKEAQKGAKAAVGRVTAAMITEAMRLQSNLDVAQKAAQASPGSAALKQKYADAKAALDKWTESNEAHKAALDAVNATEAKKARTDNEYIATQKDLLKYGNQALVLYKALEAAEASGNAQALTTAQRNIKAWVGQEGTEGAKVREAVMKAEKAAYETRQKNADQAEKDRKKRADEQARYEKQRNAANLEQAEASARRLASIDDETLANFKGNAQERYDLIQKLSQAEYVRTEELARLRRDRAKKDAAQEEDAGVRQALIAAADAKYAADTEAARNKRLATMRQAAADVAQMWEDATDSANQALANLDEMLEGSGEAAKAAAQVIIPSYKTMDALMIRIEAMQADLAQPGVAEGWIESIQAMGEAGRLTASDVQLLIDRIKELQALPEAEWMQDMKDAAESGDARYGGGQGEATTDWAMRMSYGLGREGYDAALQGYGVKSIEELEKLNATAAASMRRVYSDVLEEMEAEQQAGAERAAAILDNARADMEAAGDETAQAAEVATDDMIQRIRSRIDSMKDAGPFGMLNFLGGTENFGERFWELGEDGRAYFMQAFSQMDPDEMGKLGVSFLTGLRDRIDPNDETFKEIRARIDKGIESAQAKGNAASTDADLAAIGKQFLALDPKAADYADTLTNQLIPALEALKERTTDKEQQAAIQATIDLFKGEADAARELAQVLAARELTKLENRYDGGEGDMGEREYLTSRAKILRDMENAAWDARKTQLDEGTAAYELAYQQHKDRITAIDNDEDSGTTKSDAAGLRALRDAQDALAQAQGKNLPLYRNEQEALEKLAKKYPHLKAEIDKAAESYKKLGAVQEKLNQFNEYAGYVRDLAQAFSKLSAGLGQDDLAANFEGIVNVVNMAMGMATDVARLVASGGADIGAWVGLISKVVTGIGEMIGGFKKANAEVAKLKEQFAKDNPLLNPGDYQKAYTQSRGFFADLFAGGPEVKNDIDEVGLLFAKSIQDAVMNGVKNGFAAAVKQNDFGMFKTTLKEQVFAGVLQGVIDAFLNGEVMKNIIAPAIKQWSDALKTPDTTDDATALSNLDSALDIAVKEAERFYGAVNPMLQDFMERNGIGQDGTSTGSTRDVGAAPMAQLGLPRIEAVIPADTLKPLTDFAPAVTIFNEASKRMLQAADIIVNGRGGSGSPPPTSGLGGL